MNATKALIVGVVLAIAAYFVVGSMKGGSAPDNLRTEWISKLDANKDGKLSLVDFGKMVCPVSYSSRMNFKSTSKNYVYA
jgi:hypothetical protein